MKVKVLRTAGGEFIRQWNESHPTKLKSLEEGADVDLKESDAIELMSMKNPLICEITGVPDKRKDINTAVASA